jgi:hypothetical protein
MPTKPKAPSGTPVMAERSVVKSGERNEHGSRSVAMRERDPERTERRADTSDRRERAREGAKRPAHDADETKAPSGTPVMAERSVVKSGERNEHGSRSVAMRERDPERTERRADTSDRRASARARSARAHDDKPTAKHNRTKKATSIDAAIGGWLRLACKVKLLNI